MLHYVAASSESWEDCNLAICAVIIPGFFWVFFFWNICLISTANISQTNDLSSNAAAYVSLSCPFGIIGVSSCSPLIVLYSYFRCSPWEGLGCSDILSGSAAYARGRMLKQKLHSQLQCLSCRSSPALWAEVEEGLLENITKGIHVHTSRPRRTTTDLTNSHTREAAHSMVLFQRTTTALHVP